MSDSRLTLDDVLHVARLARVALGEDEMESMRNDLDAILGYVAKLNEIDVCDVEPTTHAIPLEMPMRKDTVIKTLSQDDVLSNAPSVQDSMFKVPKTVEGGN